MAGSATLNEKSIQEYYNNAALLRKKQEHAQKRMQRDFVEWSLKLIKKPTGLVLDAGCGWGRFTWPLIKTFDLAPNQVICTDISLAMVYETMRESAVQNKPVMPAVCSIEDLPFADNYFSTILANHVLYHLQDVPKGIAELSRVLEENGCLLATTSSTKIRPLIIDFHYQALDELNIAYELEPPTPFSLEDNANDLEKAFHIVERHYFEDEAIYENVEDFIEEYKVTGRYRTVVSKEDIEPNKKEALLKIFERLARERVGKDGLLHIPWLMGAFVCSKPVKEK